MKRQILVIHGGDSFPNYKSYLKFLKKFKIKEISPSKGWKDLLQKNLGKDYEVILPQMPNKTNAKYIEWKIWFEKYFPFVKKDVILIGHSMGGTFLVKYLSENSFPKKIKAVFLVAPVFDVDEGRPLVQFVLPNSLKNFEKKADKIFLYHSKDDEIVNFKELLKYQKVLPKAKIKIFKDKGHFSIEDFPEIIKDIRSLFR